MTRVMDTFEPGVSGPGSLGRGAYDGVVDGYLLPAAPRALIEAGRHNQIPVIVGTTSAENGRDTPPIATEADYEAAVVAYLATAGLPPALADRVLQAYPASDYPTPRDAYVALTSDIKFVCQARRDLRLLTEAQAPATYRYWFDHVPDNGGEQARRRGAFHGLELAFLFGVLDFSAGTGRYRPGPGDLAVSAAMQGYWARFAADGDPNGGGAAAWPAYDAERDPSMVLAPEPNVIDGLRAEQCGFWDNLGGRSP
jgi:para-nitrobenzyl esterase